jgi:hypothetical protein
LSIDVVYESGGYRVLVSPPHAESWQPQRLLTATDVLEQLSARGCHSTDITDALYAANPDWTHAHDAEVRRRRDDALKALLTESTEDGPEQQSDE